MSDERFEVLDTATIVARRLELGLSRNAVGGHLGIAGWVYRDLEEGKISGHFRLGIILRLGEILELEPARLFRTPETPIGDCPPAADDVMLEAALVGMAKRIDAVPLSQALGWKLDRTIRAAGALQRRLIGTGMRLSRAQGYRLEPDPAVLSTTARRRLAEAARLKSGINRRVATVLRLALAGEVDADWSKRAQNADRTALGTLLAQGILEYLPGGSMLPHQDIAFSLGLQNQVGRPFKRRPRKRDQAARPRR